MAPGRGRDPSIDETGEYEEFIEQLRLFHEQRGTSFDPSPKVGNRRVDLLRLYKRVVRDGGYDVVSDIKISKLAWRTIGVEFNLATTNLPALAFSLKTVYYRNLAAYEIVDIHKKIPPPKEILEDVSAKGGNILIRTLENYQRPISRDERFQNGVDADGSDEEGQGTPIKEDRMEVDEPGSTGGRRGLRQAPPQRIIFQPDTSSSRQVRHHSGLAKSPTPSGNLYSGMNGYNAAYASNGLPQTLATYEPKQQFPLTLRPVTTPANNPEVFKAYRASHRDASSRYGKQAQQGKTMMLPGTGFNGPSIYVRTLLSLQSGVPAEQEYALHHLVKISHERGDKYRFDGFHGLAEALIEKVLEISSLFSDVDWRIDYDYESSTASQDMLDGLNGTPDIIAKIRAARPLTVRDRIQSEELSQRLALINEAGLVIRNMVMLEENAEYISKYSSFRDLIIILLRLPDDPSTEELRHYGFEIAEQLTRYYPSTTDNPLLQTLMSAVDSTDRAIILASLRAMSRMGTYMEQVAPLQGVPTHIIHRIYEWLLVEDQELRGACLDFLYRFTAVVENIDSLFDNSDVEVLVKQVARLLLHGAQPVEEKQDLPPTRSAPQPPKPPPAPSTEEAPIPRISVDLIEQLLGYDEPERSSQWLRTCFEEDPAGEITQIALWQAYQIPFSPYGSQRPLLPAKDFITNVSTTFSAASAQVMNGPTPRFVIKGIRPRAVPVDPRGRAYARCLWHLDDASDCGDFALGPKQMWEHVVVAHLGVARAADGALDFAPRDERLYSCRWAGCQHFTTASDAVSPFAVGMHVKTHLPDSSGLAWQRAKYNVVVDGPPAPSAAEQEREPTPSASWPMYPTPTDPRQDAAGLPLTSALVLRNLARNIPKTDAAARVGAAELLWRVFAPVRGQVAFVVAHNRSLRGYLAGVVSVVVGPAGGASGSSGGSAGTWT